MKSFVIVSRLESFEFPLREATRKQIWWNAKKRQKEGYLVSIILLSDFNKKYLMDDIQIEFVNRWFWKPFLMANKIHFITGSVSIWILLGIFFKGEKKVTLTDGDMFGEKFIFIRRLISIFFPLIYKQIIVFSEGISFIKDQVITPNVTVPIPKPSNRIFQNIPKCS